MEPYARLKHQLSHLTPGAGLRLHIKRPQPAAPVPHLDPVLRARLVSAMHRPDLKPINRPKPRQLSNHNETPTTQNNRSRSHGGGQHVYSWLRLGR